MTNAPKISTARVVIDSIRVPIWRIGLALQLVVIGVMLFFIRPSDDPLILRYNAFFGVDIVGVWWQAYLIPGMCLVLFLGDLFLVEVLMRRQAPLAAVLLLLGAFCITVSGIVAAAALILINS